MYWTAQLGDICRCGGLEDSGRDTRAKRAKQVALPGRLRLPRLDPGVRIRRLGHTLAHAGSGAQLRYIESAPGGRLPGITNESDRARKARPLLASTTGGGVRSPGTMPLSRCLMVFSPTLCFRSVDRGHGGLFPLPVHDALEVDMLSGAQFFELPQGAANLDVLGELEATPAECAPCDDVMEM